MESDPVLTRSFLSYRMLEDVLEATNLADDEEVRVAVTGVLFALADALWACASALFAMPVNERIGFSSNMLALLSRPCW